MKFEFPKIVRTFSCTEYAPEITNTISVWVNPPQKLLNDLAEAFKNFLTLEKHEGWTDEQYQKEYGDKWKDAKEEYLKVLADNQGRERMNPFLTLLSELLSQSDDKWSLPDLQALLSGSQDTDPGFWLWFQNRILQTVNDHRLQRKNS